MLFSISSTISKLFQIVLRICDLLPENTATSTMYCFHRLLVILGDIWHYSWSSKQNKVKPRNNYRTVQKNYFNRTSWLSTIIIIVGAPDSGITSTLRRVETIVIGGTLKKYGSSKLWFIGYGLLRFIDCKLPTQGVPRYVFLVWYYSVLGTIELLNCGVMGLLRLNHRCFFCKSSLITQLGKWLSFHLFIQKYIL